MIRTSFAWVLVGCSSVSIEGRILDGLDNQPVAGPFKVQAKAQNADASLSCQLVDGDVTPEGAFRIDGLCTGTAYTLATDRGDLWLLDGADIPDGGWGAPKDVVAWRVPTDPGVYRMSKGEMELLRTTTDVAEHRVWKSTAVVRAPQAVPDGLPQIGAEDYLVLYGKGAVESLEILPLVGYTGKRYYGDDAYSYSIDDWVLVGAKSVNDTTVEPVTATVDPAKKIDKQRGDQMVRFVSGAALAAGRYAVLKPDDRRMYIVDFGAAAN